MASDPNGPSRGNGLGMSGGQYMMDLAHDVEIHERADTPIEGSENE
jgi:hypothetical protein